MFIAKLLTHGQFDMAHLGKVIFILSGVLVPISCSLNGTFFINLKIKMTQSHVSGTVFYRWLECAKKCTVETTCDFSFIGKKEETMCFLAHLSLPNMKSAKNRQLCHEEKTFNYMKIRSLIKDEEISKIPTTESLDLQYTGETKGTILPTEIVEFQDSCYLQQTPKNVPRDCAEIRDKCQCNDSGEYLIQPDHYPEPFLVFCDQETDGGGWTVFQNRFDGRVSFEENWSGYKNGFGVTNSEYWLGNEKLFYLANQKVYQLRVDIVNKDGVANYAKYSTFRIGNEAAKYAIKIGTHSGDAMDSLRAHDGMKFTTRDQDNDSTYAQNCAKTNGGGWWFHNCDSCNLNGVYGKKSDWSSNSGGGVEWAGVTLQISTKMMLRPAS